MFWHSDRRTILKGSFSILLLIAFAVCLIQFLSAESYDISGGTLYLQLDRAHGWTGKVNINLGPAGSVKLDTYKTPFDIKATFVLDGDQSITSPALFDSLSTIKTEGLNSAKSFFISRIPWVIALGAIAGMIIGMMISNGNPRQWVKRAGKYCLNGVIIGVIFTIGTLGFTVLTINRNYSIEYFGMAKNYEEVPGLIKAVKSNDAYKNDGIKSLIGGLGVVSWQEKELARRIANSTTRVLLISDVHDNPDAARLAENIVESGRFGNISMILNAGDTTNFGSAWEAGITTEVLPSKPVPVLMVGGNHEAAPAMKAFRSAGYHILGGSVFNQNGVSVFGDDDPSGYLDQVVPSENEDEYLAQSALILKEEWDLLDTKPQILLVHDLRQAAEVINEAKAAKEKLVVVCGHDHKMAIKEDDSITIVNPGSSGASGFGDIGFDPNSPYTFQILEFDTSGETPNLFSVTSIAFNGLGNTVDIKYTPIKQ